MHNKPLVLTATAKRLCSRLSRDIKCQMKQQFFFAKLGRALWWPFSRVRPQLQSALWVLYVGAFAVATGLLQVFIKNAFGGRTGINLQLIGHFIGSTGFGALASAFVWSSKNWAGLMWLRVSLFGAISGFVFGMIVELQHGPPVDAIDCSLATLIAAVLFPLIRWLVLKGNREGT